MNTSSIQLPTNRGLLKMILLSFITLGIYPLVIYTNISSEINTVASRYDGKKTMNFCLLVFIFSWLTLGIAPLVWFHRICGRMGNELQRRGINYSFGSSTYWIFGILLSFTIICPLIYEHKFLQAMNLINADFNAKGC